MSVLGNPLLLGGGGSAPIACGYAWNVATGTTVRLVGVPYTIYGTAYPNTHAADNKCFSYADGVFTCLKAGTYVISYFGRSGRNSSGTAVNLSYQVLHNSTAVASSTNVGIMGTHSSVTVTLAVNDTVSVKVNSAASGANYDFGYIIVPA